MATIEFTDLEGRVSKAHESFMNLLASELGKVYVVAITRDGCPVCERQKPKLKELAKALAEKHGDKVVFTQIHIRWSTDSNEESLRSKSVFGHYFYPTNLILLKTNDRAAFEYYRSTSPRMTELKRNIEAAVSVAETLAKRD